MTSSGPRKKIPEDLAEKLRAARASRSMQGERRIVTILFCDVVGSTAIAEQLDPEDWADIMNIGFEYLTAPIYHYEGIVARLMGDAILAFFGAPIAHEDDPQRAVLAGLDIVADIQPFRQKIQESYDVDFNVRVGINTGRVVVGEVGTDFAVEYTAMGDAVNLAARMEQTAEPGTVQITEETYRLVASQFEFESLGGIEVKGKRQSVLAYRVLARKEGTGRLRGITGLEAPLTGRDEELATLKQAIATVRRGRGQIVFLTGEAGLGKTRLIDDARAIWEKGTSHENSWTEGRGISYERGQPYALVAQNFRQRFGVSPTDSWEEMRAKIMAGLKDADFVGEHYDVIAQAFSGLTAPPPDQAALEGEELKNKLLSSVVNVFRFALSITPQAIVIDDVHWLDSASAELMQYLFQLVADQSILFICTQRPHQRTASLQVKESAASEYQDHYTEILLQPLDRREGDALLDGLLQGADLPTELRDLIQRKAAGNPFFIEEVVRTLIENGDLVSDETSGRWVVNGKIADIAIPDNVHAMLASRVDRLAVDARHSLQVAAVIGRRFSYRLLNALIEAPEGLLQQHLEEFETDGLIYQLPQEPEPTYIFRHDLTRDAVYHSLLIRQRREQHAKVAEAIEGFAADRLAEEAARLAYHFDLAEQQQQAQAYYSMAGDEAARLFANQEARRHYERALGLARHADASTDRLAYLFKRLGRALELSSQFNNALEVYLEMQAVAQEHEDEAMELEALIHRGQVRSTPNVEFDFEKGEALAQQALALAQKLDAREAQARVYWNLINLYRLTNRWPEGREAGERAVTLARELDQKELLAHALNDLSHVYMSSVDAKQAHELLHEASRLWREMGNQPMLADTFGTMSLADYILGEFDPAIEHSEEAYRISKSINNPWGQSYSLLMIGDVYWERGEVDRAIDALEQSIRLGEQAGFLVPQVDNRAFLGLVHGYLGDFDRGLELAGKAIDLAERSGAPYLRPSVGYLAEILVVQGELGKAEELLQPFDELVLVDPITSTFTFSARCRLLLAQKKHTEALELADQLLNLLQPLGFRLFIPKILFHKGEAQRALGQLDAAFESLRLARREAFAIGSRAIMWLILGTQAALETERGNPKNSQKLQREAVDLIEFIAANISDEQLRKSFLNMYNVKAVLGG